MHVPRIATVGLSLLVSLALTAGCGPAATGSPSGAATGAPPTASLAPVAFEIDVLPESQVGFTLPGARSVFLVRATGQPGDGPVQVTASTSGATVSVEPAALVPGAVGEVTLVPDTVSGTEVPVTVSITAQRGGVTRTVERTITVQPGEDTLRPEADAHLAPFVTWLAANRPELGITAGTAWDGTPGAWVLIVDHYLYFSSDWEADLAWHVMIPPDDWCRVNLRHRWTQLAPSIAFEISSVTGATVPHEIAPEAAVWR